MGRGRAGEPSRPGPFEQAFFLLAITAMTVVVLAQVVSRELRGRGFAWVEPVAILVLVWGSLIGSVWVSLRATHVRVGVVDHLRNRRLRTAVAALAHAVVVVTAALLVLPSYRFVLRVRGVELSGVPGVSTAALYAPLLVFFAGVAAVHAGLIAGVLRRAVRPGRRGAPPG